MKIVYLSFVFVMLFVSCENPAPSDLVQSDDQNDQEIVESNTNQEDTIVSNDSLWTWFELSIPEKYRIGDIKEFIYRETPEPGSDAWGMGINVIAFYPIGWSLDGEFFSYRLTTSNFYPEDKIIIRDIINDKVVDELLLSKFDEDTEESVIKHNPNDRAVDNFLKKHEIALNFEYAEGTTYTSELTSNSYKFEIEIDDHNSDLDDYSEKEITFYASLDISNTKRKKVAMMKRNSWLNDISIHGIIKSPIENRAILFTVLEEHGFEGENDISFHLFGSRLNDDDFAK